MILQPNTFVCCVDWLRITGGNQLQCYTNPAIKPGYCSHFNQEFMDKTLLVLGGFRACAPHLHFLSQYLEIQGFDLIAGCVIIRHAHTNKPQPALNKIQVRSSEQWRNMKTQKNPGRIRNSLIPEEKNVSLHHSGLRVTGPVRWWWESVKLSAKFKTQA